MDPGNISGVLLTPLKIIELERGNVLHAMKCGDPGYVDFGEAYFSTVNQGAIKGWKKHEKMTLNIVVPIGMIKFVIYDDREESSTKGIFQEAELSPNNYRRLTVPPRVWMAFQGLSKGINLFINIASIKHDPTESESLDIRNDLIPYNHWQ